MARRTADCSENVLDRLKLGVEKLPQEKVLILDFGGRYTQMLARKIRELHVYCEILPGNATSGQVKALQPKALIFSGSGEEGAPDVDPGLYRLGIPLLGICYGMQLLAKGLGGSVRTAGGEYKKTKVEIKSRSDLFSGLPNETEVWLSGSAYVEKVPGGFEATAAAAGIPVVAMANREKNIYAVLFQPADVHTTHGTEILKNFLFKVAGLAGDWTMDAFIDGTVRQIRDSVGREEKVICGLSGGVDSSVAAVLVHKAIGDQLTCIFVDHGLLRKDEAKQVMETFRKRLNMKVVAVDAAELFLSKLAGVTDPEKKRKIIGSEFIRVFEKEAVNAGGADYLVQGTVYTDIIESRTAAGDVIKSHHNVGGLPEGMKFKLIEPLKYLFKDEVRLVGEKLGLPEEIVWRHPFPGPGLAVRVLGEVTREKLEILRQADAIMLEEIKTAGLYRKIWQAFAVLPDIRSVGVRGDRRTYDHTIALRAVTGRDGTTAGCYRFPYEVLEKIVRRIVAEVPRVNRVVYDITPKPPSTIEWE